ncbi:MAG: RIP metalloprotease RseP [Saprospiraceae bacterium]|nr:RIP metalloprotease RseP [Saprospiraceae bacterium]
MLDGLVMAAQLILALTILVTIHELGHYLAARWFNVRVDKFFVFFDAGGKKLFSFKRGDTEYGVGWLPLGGYVKIAGMIDESMDKEYLNSEPQPWEFRSKKPWQKLIIMLGGIVFNIILGFLIFLAINTFSNKYLAVTEIQDKYFITEYGKQQGLQEGDVILGANGKTFKREKDMNMALAFGGTLDVERNGQRVNVPVPSEHFTNGDLFDLYSKINIGKVTPGSNAEEGGLKKKDQVLAVNGQTIQRYSDFVDILEANKNGSVNILVDRKGKEETLNIAVDEAGKIGFMVDSFSLDRSTYSLNKSSFGEELKFAYDDAFSVMFVNAKAFWKMLTGKVNAKENLAGPVKIAKIFGANWDWGRFWALTASLSMILAFMNVLPIPALDGGHAVFAIIEWIQGKPVSDKILETAQVIGFFIVMGLMVFVLGNDFGLFGK